MPTPRERMILSLVVPNDAYRKLSREDIQRLAAQFGVAPERVRQMASKLFGEIKSSGRDLDLCQPKPAADALREIRGQA